ncbi:nucleic acid/nucleotide deaminase of polymorphic system toxin [Kribbella voronezhensis]|uniref:Nucleic acid/nucleotide deaminase of polymorphic system toxin n=1 Tax=Kribbella voronezhensis TaxID=2512212 RepID=A0A4R7T8P3_9ACTN|nr:DddA-like double-stranded DNA deaminase toxin [Kribbella voronezhensis]TDU87568.1 nucleic acid/nucleotide deaminase of polymorphic system toxin [Kribbella voronezhensis]
MPSELQRVAQELLDSLNQIERIVPYLHDRARKYREAAGWIGGLSSNQNARMAAMQLDEAARRSEEAAHYLLQAHARGRSWVEQMVSGARTAEPAGDSTAPRPDASGGSPPPAERRQNEDQGEPEAKKPDKAAGAGDDVSPKDGAPGGRRITDEEGHRIQRKLPIREEVPVTSPKTRGKWIDENGNEEDLASGEHDEFEDVRDFLRGKGLLPPKGNVTTPSHVEVKFAMRMRQRGLMHETIIVNKLPCTGKWGCERFLRYILPPGATLTVFGPDGFKRTYTVPDLNKTEQP